MPGGNDLKIESNETQNACSQLKTICIGASYQSNKLIGLATAAEGRRVQDIMVQG
jgi:hypothetical protein